MFLLLPILLAHPAYAWPSARGDAAQQGLAKADLSSGLTVQWSHRAGSPVKGTPAVDAEHVYVGTESGALLAVYRSDGELSWRFDTEATVEGGPLLVGDHVVFGSHDGHLRAVSRKDGTLAWSRYLGDRVGAPPNLMPVEGGPGLILIGAHDGKLHAIDPSDGTSTWSYTTGNAIQGGAAFNGAQIIQGSCDGAVHVLSPKGEPLHRVEVGAWVGASVAATSTLVVAPHFGNAVHAFNPATGEARWTFRDQLFPFHAAPALSDDLVVVGGRDRVVRGLDPTSGKERWSFVAGGKVDAGLVIAGDGVLVAAADGRLTVLSAATGEEQSSVDLGGALLDGPAVYDGQVYIGSADGGLHALAPKPAAPQAKKDPT